MADYRFARQPKWIAGHVLVVALAVLFVSLGFWQLRRLDERRDLNVLIEARSQLAPEPVGDLLDPDGGADAIRFRAVEATGTYTDATSVVRSTQGGLSGGRVFGVLDLGNGETVLVLRGFQLVDQGGDVDAPPPVAGEVTVRGVAVPRHRLESVTRQALDELPDQDRMLPVVVQADDADFQTLEPVPRPELDDGPHLSYAVQWFLFTAVGLIGYPFLLRRRARD